VPVGVGVHTGLAFVGAMGEAGSPPDISVLGDTVNTAARLESFDKDYAANDACRILIGHSTFELVDGKFSTEFVQTIELKGKSRKTSIYRVLAEP
jgi:adenylate cyclase